MNPTSRLGRYSWALASTAVALSARLFLDPVLGSRTPYPTFFLAVAVSAVFGGTGPGALAAILGLLAADFFVLPPRYSLAIEGRDDQFGAVVYLLVSAMLILLSALQRRASLRADASARLAEERRIQLQEEAGLRERNRIIDASHDAFIFADGDRRITYWNRGACELYGWSEEEARGKVTHELLQTQCAQPMAEVEEILRQRGQWEGELIHACKSGAAIVVDSRHVLLRDAQGEVTGILEVNRDITGRKRAEQRTEQLYEEAKAEIAHRQRVEKELRRSNEELGQFAAAISHDLRAPLNAVTSYAQQLAEDYRGRLGEEAETCLSYLTEATGRMRRLISDLLAYSRVAEDGGGKATPIDANQALHLAELNLREKIREVQAAITHDPLPGVVANSSLVARLFQNLLENGLKFRRQEPCRIHVSATRNGQEWVFCVADNGIGIDPKHAEQLFRIFKRLHGDQYEGTGIGLAICKKIVERHGGRIWIDSAPGQGARFYFTLPAAAVLESE